MLSHDFLGHLANLSPTKRYRGWDILNAASLHEKSGKELAGATETGSLGLIQWPLPQNLIKNLNKFHHNRSQRVSPSPSFTTLTKTPNPTIQTASHSKRRKKNCVKNNRKAE